MSRKRNPDVYSRYLSLYALYAYSPLLAGRIVSCFSTHDVSISLHFGSLPHRACIFLHAVLRLAQFRGSHAEKRACHYPLWCGGYSVRLPFQLLCECPKGLLTPFSQMQPPILPRHYCLREHRKKTPGYLLPHHPSGPLLYRHTQERKPTLRARLRA